MRKHVMRVGILVVLFQTLFESVSHPDLLHEFCKSGHKIICIKIAIRKSDLSDRAICVVKWIP